jgi:hypothetical protein
MIERDSKVLDELRSEFSKAFDNLSSDGVARVGTLFERLKEFKSGVVSSEARQSAAELHRVMLLKLAHLSARYLAF